MDDQDVVHGRYPHAEAQQIPPILQVGQATPIESGYWAIYEEPGQMVGELGRGDREASAWADAAGKLKAATEAA